ncbi:MAG: chemotaxis protein CheW [Bradymonadia bacterium]
MDSTHSPADAQVAESGQGQRQYLTFMLAGEEYGVDILRVQEIKGWDTVTPLPNTPHYVKGVINLRGTIVPIIDLRERFAMPSMEYGPTTVIIVLKVVSTDEDGNPHERITGVVVDSVSDVYNVPEGQVQPPPELGQGHGSSITGLVNIDERLLILLDIDQLLHLNASGRL